MAPGKDARRRGYGTHDCCLKLDSVLRGLWCVQCVGGTSKLAMLGVFEELVRQASGASVSNL